MTESNAIEWQGLIDWGQYFDTTGSPGGVDILCAGPGKLAPRIGELAALATAALFDKDGKPVYRKFVVILPPDAPDELAQLLRLVAEVIPRFRGTPLDDEERDLASRRLEAVRCSSLASSDLMALIEHAPHRSFYMVIAAARYRSEIELSHVLSRTLLEEDLWVPHLSALAQGCISVAETASSCILLDSGQYLPVSPAHLKALQELDTGLLGSGSSYNLSAILREHGDWWASRVRVGHAEQAMAMIDDLPALYDDEKPLLKIQTLNRGRATLAAAQMLRDWLATGIVLPAPQKGLLARVAMEGNDEELAVRMLAEAASELHDLEPIERALTLSRRLNLDEVQDELVSSLAALHPNSPGLRLHRLMSLINSFVDGVQWNDPRTGGEDDALRLLGSFLCGGLIKQEPPDYGRALKYVHQHWPEWTPYAALACAADARRRQEAAEVLRLIWLVESPLELEPYAAQLLLWGLERILVAENGDPQLDELVGRAVRSLIYYLSRHPSDAGVRENLLEALSVEVSALRGTALLAHSVMHFLGLPQSMGEQAAEPAEVMSEQEIESFIGPTMEWLSSTGPVDLATVKLPDELLTSHPDVILDLLVHAADRAPIGNDVEDLAWLRNLVSMAFAVEPHTSGIGLDLEALRLATAKLAVAGHLQDARDLVEAGLQSTHGSMRRTRLAWFAFADTYQRAQNRLKALLAIGCTFACATPIPPLQAYYETLGALRVLRDTGLLDFARAIIPACEALLERAGVPEEARHRFETIRIGLEVQALQEDSQAHDLPRLLEAASANLAEILELKDEVLPAALMLAQLLRRCEEAGLTVPAHIKQTLDAAVASGGAGAATLIQLLGHGGSSAEGILQRLHLAQSARFSEDVGSDVHILVIASRRLLTQAANQHDVRSAAFAAELMADHAISLPSRQDSPSRRWLPDGVGEPYDQLATLAQGPSAIVLLAVDSTSRLIRFNAQGQVDGPHIDSAGFSLARLQAWSASFPLRYGLDRAEPNIFYTSLEGLALEMPVAGSIVFIMDARIQHFPPQLFLVDGELLGMTRKTAIAPSLAWLSAARVSQGAYARPAIAWISTAVQAGAGGALEMVAQRLEPTFELHGIPLNTDAEIPEALARSELVIITAHGGVASEGRFFKVVSDEDALKVSALQLSRSLRDAGVVVLFVCSGGRQDAHPTAQTSIGLPKELLDHGCRAVIASPWPLSTMVPAHWLPTFLERWDAGDNLIDATFAANEAVRRNYSYSPADCMAMTLYGDPWIKKQSR